MMLSSDSLERYRQFEFTSLQQAVYLSRYLTQEKCKKPRFAALLGHESEP